MKSKKTIKINLFEKKSRTRFLNDFLEGFWRGVEASAPLYLMIGLPIVIGIAGAFYAAFSGAPEAVPNDFEALFTLVNNAISTCFFAFVDKLFGKPRKAMQEPNFSTTTGRMFADEFSSARSDVSFSMSTEVNAVAPVDTKPVTTDIISESTLRPQFKK